MSDKPFRYMVNKEIQAYNDSQSNEDKDICATLMHEIYRNLPKAEDKIWHAHPVWFLEGNPVVGYSKQKAGVRLMFWSGADFEEESLAVKGSKFKDASVFYNAVSEIKINDIERWLQKAQEIQWDYKNLVSRKGKLERLK